MTTQYRVRRTLPVRVELIRQLRRRRTLIAFLLMIALPVIVVLAVKFGPSADNRGGGGRFGGGSLDLVGLATSSAWNFTVTMVFFASGFLLVVIAALFFGDTVASEASWSSLRYLLAAPVPRRRLLLHKLIVALLLTAVALGVLIIASFVIGAITFGVGSLTSPLGGTFDASTALVRTLIITGYVLTTLLIAAGIAFLLSTLTDVPLGAVGGAVIIVIISNILDSLDALGSIRDWLPTRFANSWVGALSTDVAWTDMAKGAMYSISVFAVLVLIALVRFDRKNILS